MNELLLSTMVALSTPSAPTAPSEPVRAGIDALLLDGAALLQGKRIAVVTHPAAVTAGLQATADVLASLPGVTIAALMGPEHGIRGAAYAGEKVGDQKDPKTGIPVFSLYGKSTKPKPEMLKGIDAIVFDIQDIGVRSYTYPSTLALVMEAAAEAKIPVIVLDRPNPLGGERVEGNVPPENWPKGFICWLRVPYVYGMTPGELALMINGEGWLANGVKADLTVVPMKGWRRKMLFQDTGLPWVPTSPHIPHSRSAFFYPMTGLSGDYFNNGVGYTLPFELFGAPWIDGERLSQELNALSLPGLSFRPVSYKPFYARHKGSLVHGVQIHALDFAAAPLASVSFYILEVLNRLYPERMLWEEPPPPKPSRWAKLSHRKQPKIAPIWAEWDAAVGDPGLRTRLALGASVNELSMEWRRDSAGFAERRKTYLLYD